MLFLLLIPIVGSDFTFKSIRANFKNVNKESTLFEFLGETSIYLYVRQNIEFIITKNDTWEIYTYPFVKDVRFEYNSDGFTINSENMRLAMNQGSINRVEPFQVCYDFKSEKIIFESVIALLAFVIVLLIGGLSREKIYTLLLLLKGYIKNENQENETQEIETQV